MNRRIWILILIAVVIELPLFMLRLHPFVIFICAAAIMISGLTCWWQFKIRKLTAIMDDQCDPEKFIEECEKFKRISNRTAFQNFCNVNIAVAHLESGRNDESLEILLNDIDLQKRNSKMFLVAYHLTLFCVYLNIDDMEKAAFEYENYLKELRRGLKHSKAVLSIDTDVFLYQYKVNKSKETAKIFLEQLEYLYKIHSEKMSMRIRLHFIFDKAAMLLELEDYEGAVKKYTVVAKNGKDLWIAKESRAKLQEIAARRKGL